MQLFRKIKSGLKKIPKKKAFFLILPFFVLFVFFLPRSASAQVLDIVAGALSAIPAAIFMLFMAFVLLLSLAFSSLAGALLNWVLSPSFVAVSYTSPLDRGLPGEPGYLPGNPIINIGLGITKSGVNMLLVLFLVYIAVAIALRLGGEGNARKMLVRLIIVALLVNFAPVLVGLIVDAANILMTSTLNEVGTSFSDAVTQFSVLGSGLVTKFLRIPTFSGQIGLITQALIMIFLNVAIGLGLLLYAAIFIFRYIVIWLLVIFSPIAFVGWIHPATKKLTWDLWWRQLLEWSFIGAFMAYFLYLSAQAIRLIPSLYSQPVTQAGFTTEVAGTFSQALPYFVVLVLLYLGFTMGLQTGAMGAGAVIGLTKRAGGWVATKAWRGTKSWTEEKLRVPVGKTPEGMPIRVGIKELTGQVVKKWEKVPVLRAFLPEKAIRYGEYRPAIEAEAKEAANISSPHNCYQVWAGHAYGIKAAAKLNTVIGRGDSQDWFNEFKKVKFNKYFKDKYKTWQEVPDREVKSNKEFNETTGRLLQIDQQGGLHQANIRSAPRLARAAFNRVPGYTKTDGIENEDAAVRKAVKESRTQHIKNWEPEEMNDEAVRAEALTRGRDFWQSFFSQVKRGHEEGLKVFKDEFKKFLNETPAAQAKPVLEAWKDYEKAYPERIGSFQFLAGARAREQGWSTSRVIELATDKKLTPEEVEGIEAYERKRGKKTKGTSPSAAMGLEEDEEE